MYSLHLGISVCLCSHIFQSLPTMFIHVETVTIKCKNSKPNIIVIVGLGCNQNYQDDVHTVVDYSPYALDLLYFCKYKIFQATVSWCGINNQINQPEADT